MVPGSIGLAIINNWNVEQTFSLKKKKTRREIWNSFQCTPPILVTNPDISLLLPQILSPAIDSLCQILKSIAHASSSLSIGASLPSLLWAVAILTWFPVANIIKSHSCNQLQLLLSLSYLSNNTSSPSQPHPLVYLCSSKQGTERDCTKYNCANWTLW